MSSAGPSLASVFLAELTYEAISTRKILERIPNEQFNWQPHPRSMSLGRLASHVAEVPEWGTATLNTVEMNMKSDCYQPWCAADSAELLKKFDEGLKAFQEALSSYPDSELATPWKFIMDGNLVFEQPRAGVLRGMIFSHLIHHRGQLSVYLRLLDIPVPSIYGPSADEA